jgi:hypothetical protein
MFKINSKNIFSSVIIGLGVLLVIIAVGIVSSRVASKDKIAENSPLVSAGKDQSLKENLEVSYVLKKADGQSLDFKLTKTNDLNTVFDFLKKVSETDKVELKYNNNYSFGVFIESIADIKNGDNGKYWQYYINNVLGDVAADKKEVKAGDKVEWRFEKVPEF